MRLKMQREQLGLSRAALAAFGGIKANAQLLYENGTRFPRGEYLIAIGNSGVDIQYVLLGLCGSSDYASLADTEQVFMKNLRRLGVDDRKNIERILFRIDDLQGGPVG